MDEAFARCNRGREEIENGIAARLFRVVAGWQEHAVGDGMTQDLLGAERHSARPVGENEARQGEATQEQRSPRKSRDLLNTARASTGLRRAARVAG